MAGQEVRAPLVLLFKRESRSDKDTSVVALGESRRVTKLDFWDDFPRQCLSILWLMLQRNVIQYHNWDKSEHGQFVFTRFEFTRHEVTKVTTTIQRDTNIFNI